MHTSIMEVWKKMWVGVFFWTQCTNNITVIQSHHWISYIAPHTQSNTVITLTTIIIRLLPTNTYKWQGSMQDIAVVKCTCSTTVMTFEKVPMPNEILHSSVAQTVKAKRFLRLVGTGGHVWQSNLWSCLTCSGTTHLVTLCDLCELQPLAVMS